MKTRIIIISGAVLIIALSAVAYFGFIKKTSSEVKTDVPLTVQPVIANKCSFVISSTSPGGWSDLNDMVSDSKGNIYVVGYIKGKSKTVINGFEVTTHGSKYNPVLIKFTPDGKVMWIKTTEPDPSQADCGECSFTNVAVDASGNIYAAGYIKSTNTLYSFGNGKTFTSQDGTISQGFVIKYNQSGEAQWVKAETSSPKGICWPTAIAVDSKNSRLYLVGYTHYKLTYDFGDGQVADFAATGNNDSNSFLVQYSTENGKTEALRTVGPAAVDPVIPGRNQFTDVAVDKKGNVYVTGFICKGGKNPKYSFSGPEFEVKTHSENGVLVKYNPALEGQWVRGVLSVDAGLGTYSNLNSVAVDSSGNVYAAGRIENSATYNFGNSVKATGHCQTDLLLLKYDSSGTAQWARTSMEAEHTSCGDFKRVFIDDENNVFVSGWLSVDENVQFDFGNNQKTQVFTGFSNSFVLVKYDPSGAAKFVKTIVSPTVHSEITAITAYSGLVYITGKVDALYNDKSDAVDFGDGKTIQTVPKSMNFFLIAYEK